MDDFRNLNIVVLAGGPGAEREVSLVSAKAVKEALEQRCDHVQLLDVTEPGKLQFPDGTDLAFNVIHGTYGEDGVLQADLEALGVPYTGAGVASSQLAFDKFKSKDRFVEAGIKTPTHRILTVAEAASFEPEFPCVVKPPCQGSSVGVHIVREPSEWAAALEDGAKYGPELLIEQFVEGKELTVGILGDQALPIIHIQPRSGFYDISNKYPWMNQGGGSDYFCPADIPEDLTKAIQAEALRAHQVLGTEIYSRVDLLLNAQDEFFVLEVNTIPGMTASSLLPKAARQVGIEFDELCVRIAQESLLLRA